MSMLMKMKINAMAMSMLVLAGAVFMPYVCAAKIANGVDYDSSAEYDETDNMQPDGQWSYGKYAAPANWGSFVQLAETNYYGPGTGGSEVQWTDTSSSYPKVGEFFIHPDGTEMAVKRWTSDVTGTIEIDYDVFSLRSSEKDFYVIHEGTKLSLADGDQIDLSGAEHHVDWRAFIGKPRRAARARKTMTGC